MFLLFSVFYCVVLPFGVINDDDKAAESNFSRFEPISLQKLLRRSFCTHINYDSDEIYLYRNLL